MRSHEERIAEVRRRITEKERQKKRKQRRIVAISCIAACLAVIFGASFVMSGISRQMVPGISSGYETAATILGGGAAPEYIIIGVLSFLLGVCVTILCFRVHLLDKEVLDIVSVIVFRNTTDLLCIGIRLGLQRYFSLSPAIYSLLPGGKKLFLSEIPAGSADRSSVVRILLYLW